MDLTNRERKALKLFTYPADKRLYRGVNERTIQALERKKLIESSSGVRALTDAGRAELDRMKARWVTIPGTANFSYRSLIAVYLRTDTRSGKAIYRVFPSSLVTSKRIPTLAWCVGGLPSTAFADELIRQKIGE
jgi:hypothetical protein